MCSVVRSVVGEGAAVVTNTFRPANLRMNRHVKDHVEHTEAAGFIEAESRSSGDDRSTGSSHLAHAERADNVSVRS